MNLLLDAIINFHKDDPRLFGVVLTSVEEAEQFYIKYGFRFNPNVDLNMFYPFEPYNILYHDKKMLKKHFVLAFIIQDKNMFDRLLEKTEKGISNKSDYLKLFDGEDY